MCPPPERERRLRSHLRHERMALAESTHHSAQRQKTARAGEEARDALHGHVPEAPLLWGVGQHLCLRFLAGSHGFCGMLWDIFPCLHSMFLWDIEQFFRAHSHDLEQVIEVPKILPFDVPIRTAVRVPQLAEQLVEVPTIVSCSSIHRTVDQHVDIPVPGGGGSSSGLQGFSPGQSSTVTPSSKKRISERIVEQIVGPVSSGGLYGSLSGQGSSSLQYALGGRCPWYAVVQVPVPQLQFFYVVVCTPVVAQSLSHGPDSSSDLGFTSCFTWWSTSLFPRRAGSLSRRGAEAGSWSKLFV